MRGRWKGPTLDEVNKSQVEADARKRGRNGSRMTREERRAQLVRVTLKLVQRYGVTGATTARIAAAAGVTEPTLYRYFPSRKELLLAAFAVIHGEAMQQVVSSQNPNALQRLREVGERHNRDVMARKPGPHQNAIWEFNAAPAHLGLKDTVIENHQHIIDAIAAIVDDGKAQGTIRPEVDSKQTAWRIMGFFFFEDLAHSMRAHDIVLTGLSLHSLDTVLNEIAVMPGS